MHRIIFFVFANTLFGQALFSQDYFLGLQFATNTVFCSVSSDKSIENGPDYVPFPGAGISLLLKKEVMKKIEMLTILGYDITSKLDISEQAIRGNDGSESGTMSNRICINNSLYISPVIQYKLLPSFRVGAGISFNTMLSSTLWLDTGDGSGYNSYSNNFYRLFYINLPLRMEYQFKKISLYTQFNKGITNSLKGKDTSLKEVDNMLSFGIQYMLETD